MSREQVDLRAPSYHAVDGRGDAEERGHEGRDVGLHDVVTSNVAQTPTLHAGVVQDLAMGDDVTRAAEGRTCCTGGQTR